MSRKYVLGPNAARELKKLLRGSGEVSRRQNFAKSIAFDSEYVQPYTVQWAQSANDGAGSWIVWLPSDGCLIVNGESVDLKSELESVGGEYPSGWYALDCLDENATTLFLNVHVPDADDEEEEDEDTSDDDENAVTASFSGEAEEADDGETVWPIEIAEFYGKDVSQVVTSAITIGGDSRDSSDCVTSLNDETGDMDIIGGPHIIVETNGKTVKISYGEDKEDSDDDPNNPDNDCDHPGETGGVSGGIVGLECGVPGDNRGDDGKAGADCCGGSLGNGTGVGNGSSSAGVSTADDGKGAQSGTVVTNDGNGNTTTGTSYKGIQKPSYVDNSSKGRKITDVDVKTMNGDSNRGKKLGDGDIRKFESNDSSYSGLNVRIGTTDLHGFVNNDQRQRNASRI